MKLPASLKALKFVAQGKSFATAKQLVKDRRLAKSLAVQGLDKQLFDKAEVRARHAHPKATVKGSDARDETLSAQVAFYKKQGLTQLNPSLASKSYIQDCRKLGIDPVWDEPPMNYHPSLTFVPYRPPLHLTKEQIFDKPPLPVGIAEDKFFDALRLQRKTVKFADVIASANAKSASTKTPKVRFADEVPSCKDILRGGLAFDGTLKVSVKDLVGKLSKVDGKKTDR